MTEPKYNNWRLEKDGYNIVWCYIDKQDASTNVLSTEVLTEFGEIVNDIANNVPRGLIILSGKENGFIAGADVVEFTGIEDRKQALEMMTGVHEIFNRLESLTCPTLALINGFCLGGGLELALACRYRVVLDDPKSRIGLPEVKLGIHPGFGGSVRTIRLLGAIQAMQMMLEGKTLDAYRAKKTGLVDRVVPLRQFNNAATAMILDEPPKTRPGIIRRAANLGFVRPLLAWFFRRELGKRVNKDHYPSPYALVDLWERHAGNEKTMLVKEADSVADLIVSDSARNLVRAFMLQEQLKSAGKLPGFEPGRVHVIGAGVMGGDIAAWCVLKGFTVTLQDRAPEYIAPAIGRAGKLFKKRLKVRHRITAAMDRLIPDVNGEGLKKADVVIEAIIEDLEAKAGLFRELESKVGEHTILASNTSSIPLDEISQHLKQPERLVGIHFFNPVASMQLVEIVHSEKTAEEWINKASSFCRKIDRLPLQVKSAPGFLVNRILTPYLLESVAIHEEGVPAAVIDDVAKKFGMPMGPVELSDRVGLDICLHVARNLSRKIDIEIPDILQEKVDRGELGRKTGKGFYDYKNGKPIKKSGNSEVSIPADLEDRLVLRILNECVACLREGIVAGSDMLDAGMIYGTGFAPFLGGPMNYARVQGYEEILERFLTLEVQYGDRFKPDTAWQDLITENA